MNVITSVILVFLALVFLWGIGTLGRLLWIAYKRLDREYLSDLDDEGGEHLTRFLCRQCRKDLTPLFYERYGKAMNDLYPQLRDLEDRIRATGLDVKTRIKRIGGIFNCPVCQTVNDIHITLEQLKEIVKEMNR